MKWLLFSTIIILNTNILCQPPTIKDGDTYEESKEFREYWYQGKAELASYKLQQSRYGEIHDGEAVLIFVTEPFSKSKQVKKDNPSNDNDTESVLKLNFTKKFQTGIYPYSMMTSVFTPVSLEHTIKTTTTSQEWCGHTYTQLNLKGKHYDYKQFSYFESEGDEERKIETATLEDELWNMIRIDPKRLPEGTVKIIPGAMTARLTHIPQKVVEAQITLSTVTNNAFGGGKINAYSVTYPSLNRNLVIYFEKAFPHRVLGWEETYQGIGGQVLTTTGKLKKTIQLDYWNKHNKKDEQLLRLLDL